MIADFSYEMIADFSSCFALLILSHFSYSWLKPRMHEALSWSKVCRHLLRVGVCTFYYTHLVLHTSWGATARRLRVRANFTTHKANFTNTHVGGQQHAVCEFELSFTPEGDVRGQGTDDVGCYLIRGRLADSNGCLSFTKQYQLGSRNAQGW